VTKKKKFNNVDTRRHGVTMVVVAAADHNTDVHPETWESAGETVGHSKRKSERRDAARTGKTKPGWRRRRRIRPGQSGQGPTRDREERHHQGPML